MARGQGREKGLLWGLQSFLASSPEALFFFPSGGRCSCRSPRVLAGAAACQRCQHLYLPALSAATVSFLLHFRSPYPAFCVRGCALSRCPILPGPCRQYAAHEGRPSHLFSRPSNALVADSDVSPLPPSLQTSPLCPGIFASLHLALWHLEGGGLKHCAALFLPPDTTGPVCLSCHISRPGPPCQNPPLCTQFGPLLLPRLGSTRSAQLAPPGSRGRGTTSHTTAQAALTAALTSRAAHSIPGHLGASARGWGFAQSQLTHVSLIMGGISSPLWPLPSPPSQPHPSWLGGQRTVHPCHSTAYGALAAPPAAAHQALLLALSQHHPSCSLSSLAVCTNSSFWSSLLRPESTARLAASSPGGAFSIPYRPLWFDVYLPAPTLGAALPLHGSKQLVAAAWRLTY